MAEPRAKARRPQVDDPAKEREAWVRFVEELVEEIKGWVQPEWSTRVVEKDMRDSVLGRYRLPSLLMQREIARVLPEPITRFAPGVDGVVDLYLMPAFDDIATIYRTAGEWRVNYAYRGGRAVFGIKGAESRPLTGENFLRVLDSIAANAP